MKILQVIPYFCCGGAETMCRNLSLALAAQGHHVTVASLYSTVTPISRELEAAGIQVHYLGKRPGPDVTMIPKLTSLMRRLRPDAVHTHLNTITYAVAAAHFAGVPRCIHTIHNIAEQESENAMQRSAASYYFRHGWAAPAALSPQIRQTVMDLYGLPEDAVPVVANGIDLSRISRKQSYALHDPPVLLHIGRFTEQKNHAGIVSAFLQLRKSFPSARLRLVGGGALQAGIREQVRSLGLDTQVQFTGEVTDVAPYLQEADIFVLPSLYEGLPMTLIEAMAAGLPVAASPVGGVPDLIQNGANGLLAAADPASTAAAWAALLSDQALRERLGANACITAARFSATEMARQYTSLYQAPPAGAEKESSD